MPDQSWIPEWVANQVREPFSPDQTSYDILVLSDSDVRTLLGHFVGMYVYEVEANCQRTGKTLDEWRAHIRGTLLDSKPKGT